MLHKVKEIFQKLVNKKEEAPQVEAPYKIEPEIKPPVPEVKEVVAEEPVKNTKPKKPRPNPNGNKPKQRKNK